MKTFLFGFLMILALTGCTPLRSFRVVDARSGKPIEGVQIERLQSSIRPSPMPLVLYDNLSPVEKQITDESGTTAFEKTASKVMCNPSSTHPGYGRAYVISSWSGVKIRYPDEYREISVKPVDGVIEVPLPNRRLGGRSASDPGFARDGFYESFPETRGRELTASGLD